MLLISLASLIGGLIYKMGKLEAIKELDDFKALLKTEDPNKNPHLDSDLGSYRYIKNANKIKTYLNRGKILDWGCGFGQMSYLLKNRGFEVVSYDIDPGGKEFLSKIEQPFILAADQVNLPFTAAAFDAVVSSGVLEHVAEPLKSLQEIDRVLKPRGYFFVFMLPNKYSYIEFISDALGRGDHPVKYTKKKIKGLLAGLGYEVIYIGYRGFLPYNLKGFPSIIRKSYHRLDFLWDKIDGLLSVVPIINWFCTNIELSARKIK